MKTHDLKCWPEPFAAMREGRKRFELRRDDRGFAVGDTLVIREWEPLDRWNGMGFDDGPDGRYTGATPLRMCVTYLLAGGRFGLPDDLCVMSLEPEAT